MTSANNDPDHLDDRDRVNPSETTPQDDYSQTKRSSRSLAEWVTLGFASLIVGTIASLVVYAWATQRDEPPILEINRPETIRITNGQFYVPFEVVNKGGKTAEAIQAIAELRINGRLEESSDLQIDFLSSDETEEGAFIFTQDPGKGELTLRVGSYKIP
jgi:uncharacterized protein (TIGR02588 family)